MLKALQKFEELFCYFIQKFYPIFQIWLTHAFSCAIVSLLSFLGTPGGWPARQARGELNAQGSRDCVTPAGFVNDKVLWSICHSRATCFSSHPRAATRGSTCTAGARRIEYTVLKRSRYYDGVCEWQGALKYGSPGRSPGMTCTAGARRVECTVLQRPRYSGGICEWQGALKYGSPGRSPGMTRRKEFL